MTTSVPDRDIAGLPARLDRSGEAIQRPTLNHRLRHHPLRLPRQPSGAPSPPPSAIPSPVSLPPALLSDEAPQPRPDKAFVRRHPAHFIAFGGGTGLSRVAPGTAGTLAAFPYSGCLLFFLTLPAFCC